ncbi:EpsG family protein [Clostridium tarantellae]|uniref:EpsG family protein n=1 Tax=Clostridium tarantellae TaxID=39493 RepID=UPI00128C0710|nr:EpsG family protein [Clostridium tarantellae]
MSVFYATLISTYILSWLSRIGKEKKRIIFSIFWLFLATLILIIVSGLRSGIGDTNAYMHSYDLLVQNPSSFELNGDFALNLISIFLMQISTNPQILIFTTAFLTNLFNMIIFYKFGTCLELQVYMYITSGYYTVTMNGIRQSLAAAFLFLSINLIIKGNFKMYAIIVLIISTFHASALIMIPLYFIVREEAWSKKVMKMMLLACIGVFFYDLFSEILFKLLENTKYAAYSQVNEGGSSVMRTIVNSVPVILAYIKRNELRKIWPESNIFVNFALINLIFVGFGMFNWIFNRFTIYFQLYNFILLPFIIKKCFKGREKILVYFGFVFCYFIFFYREQVIGLNMSYPSQYLTIENLFYEVIP